MPQSVTEPLFIYLVSNLRLFIGQSLCHLSKLNSVSFERQTPT